MSLSSPVSSRSSFVVLSRLVSSRLISSTHLAMDATFSRCWKCGWVTRHNQKPNSPQNCWICVWKLRSDVKLTAPTGRRFQSSITLCLDTEEVFAQVNCKSSLRCLISSRLISLTFFKWNHRYSIVNVYNFAIVDVVQYWMRFQNVITL